MPSKKLWIPVNILLQLCCKSPAVDDSAEQRCDVVKYSVCIRQTGLLPGWTRQQYHSPNICFTNAGLCFVRYESLVLLIALKLVSKWMVSIITGIHTLFTLNYLKLRPDIVPLFHTVTSHKSQLRQREYVTKDLSYNSKILFIVYWVGLYGWNQCLYINKYIFMITIRSTMWKMYIISDINSCSGAFNHITPSTSADKVCTVVMVS